MVHGSDGLDISFAIVHGISALITITFDGLLANEFESFGAIAIDSVHDVLCAIEANIEGFRTRIMELTEQGFSFVIHAGHQSLEESELVCPLNKKIKSIRISAIPAGSGGAAGKILPGLALLGLGLFGVGFLGFSAINIALLGGAMLLQGVMSLFGRVKDPESDENDGKKSLIISNPSQTLREGGRIPRLYGRAKVGLYPISVKIRSFQLA